MPAQAGISVCFPLALPAICIWGIREAADRRHAAAFLRALSYLRIVHRFDRDCETSKMAERP
jgi:hypothetical protein